jgi:hypothetical protein
MLHASGIKGFADAFQKSFTLDSIVACDPDFDQLVSLEADVDLLHHSIGQAFVADQDDGGEAVSPGFEGLALKRAELNGHEGLGKSGILDSGA